MPTDEQAGNGSGNNGGAMVAKAYKWAWRYGALEVEEFDTVSDALWSAVVGVESESFDCVEEPTTGTVLDQDSAEYKAIEEQYIAQVRRAANERSTVAAVEVWYTVRSCWGVFDAFYELSEAIDESERLARQFGKDRVRVVPSASTPG